MMKTVQILGLGLLAAMLLSGCATVESRINRNMQTFLLFSAEEQATIREGKIKLGFTPDMVRIALGKPRRIYRRLSDEGTTTVWAYVRETSDSRYRYPYYWRGHYGRHYYSHEYDPFYWREHTREIDVLRIEFRDGKVVGIEQLDE